MGKKRRAMASPAKFGRKFGRKFGSNLNRVTEKEFIK